MKSYRLAPAGPLTAAACVLAWLLGPLLGVAAEPTAAPKTGAQSAEKSPYEKWEREIQAYEAADHTNPPPQGAILFVGASGIRMWTSLARDFPNQQVLNRGFGGSGMADSVHFADRIVTPYKPRLIVIQAGGNDINAGKSPVYVLEQFQAFVEKVRAKLPDTRIVYLSINPSPARWSQRETQQQANQLIQKYIAAGKNLDYIDFWSALIGPDGQPREDLFIKDRLHNNAAGYAIRANVVRPHLK